MDLQKKRADLVAQVEQFVGQINRNNGAIALLDEMIAEQKAEEAQITTIPNEWWKNAASAAPSWVQPEVKAMQSSLPEDVA